MGSVRNAGNEDVKHAPWKPVRPFKRQRGHRWYDFDQPPINTSR
jgi:hypothetical protein